MAPRSFRLLPCFAAVASIWCGTMWTTSFLAGGLGTSSPGSSFRGALVARRAAASSPPTLDANLDALVDVKFLDVHTGSAESDFVKFRQNFAETPETLLNQ